MVATIHSWEMTSWTLSIYNPFPNRNAGINWYDWYNISENKERLENTYSSIEYNASLDNATLSDIKNYNKTNNYLDWDSIDVNTGNSSQALEPKQFSVTGCSWVGLGLQDVAPPGPSQPRTSLAAVSHGVSAGPVLVPGGAESICIYSSRLCGRQRLSNTGWPFDPVPVPTYPFPGPCTCPLLSPHSPSWVLGSF